MSAAAANTAPAASAASLYYFLWLRSKKFEDAKEELAIIADILMEKGSARENNPRPSPPLKWLASLNLADLSRREKTARETLLSLAPFAYRSGPFEKWHILLCRDGLLNEICIYPMKILLTADGNILRGRVESIHREFPLSLEEATYLTEQIELIRESDERDEE
jgi:hypothetical protein